MVAARVSLPAQKCAEAVGTLGQIRSAVGIGDNNKYICVYNFQFSSFLLYRCRMISLEMINRRMYSLSRARQYSNCLVRLDQQLLPCTSLSRIVPLSDLNTFISQLKTVSILFLPIIWILPIPIDTDRSLYTRQGRVPTEKCPSALAGHCDWIAYSQEYKDNVYQIKPYLDHLSNSDSSVPVPIFFNNIQSNHVLQLPKLPPSAYLFSHGNGNARYPQKSYHDTTRDSLDSHIEPSLLLV